MLLGAVVRVTQTMYRKTSCTLRCSGNAQCFLGTLRAQGLSPPKEEAPPQSDLVRLALLPLPSGSF